MTIASAVNRSGPYNGNGVTTVFPYEFKIEKEAHVQVISATAENVETVLELTADYTVNGVGDEGGGEIVLTSPLASGLTLTMLLNVPFTQETDLENQGAYYAETVEAALDLAAQRDLQLLEKMGRAVLLPASSDDEGGALAAALAANITRLAQSADEIDVVSGIKTEVETVAGIADDVTLLATVGPVLEGTASAARIDEALFVGNGTRTDWTLPRAPGVAENVIVVIGNGAWQDTPDYTVNGTTLTITPAVADGVKISARILTLVSSNVTAAHAAAAEASRIAAEAAAATAAILTANVAYGFDTDAKFRAASIPLPVESVIVRGFHSAGDGGIHLRKRVSAPGSVKPWHCQDSAGNWWSVAGKVVTPQAFGATADGTKRTVADMLIGAGKRFANLAAATAVYSTIALSTDSVDLAAMTAASDYINSVGGGTVKLEGHYITDYRWKVDADNIRIDGGKTAKIENVATVSVDVVYATNRTGVHVSGVLVNGRRDLKPDDSGSNRGIYIEGCKKFSVVSCEVQNTREHGVRLGSYASSGMTTEDGFVSGNNIHHCGSPLKSRGNGVWGFWQVYRCVVSGNILYENEGGGVYFDDVSGTTNPAGGGCEHITIAGNIILSSFQDLKDSSGTSWCIAIGGSRHVAITGNVGIGYRNGVVFEDSQANQPTGRATISGNRMSSYQYPLVVRDASSIVAAGNRFEQLPLTIVAPELTYTQSCCIKVENDRSSINGGGTVTNFANNVIIANNEVISRTGGIFVDKPSSLATVVKDIQIDGNQVYRVGLSAAGATDYGIWMRYSDECQVTGNNVLGFYDGIFIDGNNEDVIVDGNKVRGCARYGIALSGKGYLIGVFRNTTRLNVSAGLRVNGSANVATTYIKDNEFLDGTALSGTVSTAVRQNNIPAI